MDRRRLSLHRKTGVVPGQRRRSERLLPGYRIQHPDQQRVLGRLYRRHLPCERKIAADRRHPLFRGHQGAHRCRGALSDGPGRRRLQLLPGADRWHARLQVRWPEPYRLHLAGPNPVDGATAATGSRLLLRRRQILRRQRYRAVDLPRRTAAHRADRPLRAEPADVLSAVRGQRKIYLCCDRQYRVLRAERKRPLSLPRLAGADRLRSIAGPSGLWFGGDRQQGRRIQRQLRHGRHRADLSAGAPHQFRDRVEEPLHRRRPAGETQRQRLL